VDIGYGAAGGALVIHCDTHGRLFGLRTGLEVAQLWLPALRLGQNQRGGYSFHSLEGERLLAFEFFAALLTPAAELVMFLDGDGKAARCAFHIPFLLVGAAADIVVRASDELAQGKLNVVSDAFHFTDTFGLDLLKERHERPLLQETHGLGYGCHVRKRLGRARVENHPESSAAAT
jgi:hypothetical protein